jgi:cytochrome c1
MTKTRENMKRRSGVGRRKAIVMIGFAALLILLISAVFFLFQSESVSTDSEPTQQADGDDWNRIENGIHLRTGLKDDEGLMTVVTHCTACHSAQLVIQNRMNKERWNATIRWMQETQNLWDLGENQEVIVDYLVRNYPPTEKGRRENLKDIEWYELED